MATLESLVRINRWALDEKRRSLAEIERMRERLREELARLEAEFASETAAAQDSVEVAGAFAVYAEEVRRRRSKLQLTLSDLARAEEVARAELAAIYQEVKSYELALNRQQRRKRAAAERREQKSLDELGIGLHHRRV